MPETITLKHIHHDIVSLRKELREIKQKFVDIDVVLTDDDVDSLKEAEMDLRLGKTKRLN